MSSQTSTRPPEPFRELLPVIIPTADDLAVFERRERSINTDWSKLPSDWHCPCCNRSKTEIVRWGRHAAGYRRHAVHGSPGWKTVVVLHHCHGPEHGMPQRFESVMMCGDCNSIDGRLKGQVSHLIKPWFSMTPTEISMCMTSQIKPHEGIDRLDLAPVKLVRFYSKYHAQNISAFMRIYDQKRQAEIERRNLMVAVAAAPGFGFGRFKAVLNTMKKAEQAAPVVTPAEASSNVVSLVIPVRRGFGMRSNHNVVH